MLAAWDGHTDTMQALAALGADIHIQDEVSTMCIEECSCTFLTRKSPFCTVCD